MTSSSGGSAELLTSGPPSERPRGRRRLLGLAVALVAIGGVVAAVGLDLGRGPAPAVTYVEKWIAAWNDRDAQAVSSMTCDYRPAFVPAGIIQTYLRDVPPDGPVVVDHLITGTEDSVAHDRPVVRVRVTYVRAGHDGLLETSVFVRVRDEGDMCIGAFTNW